jgi:hypothetical protein
MQFTLEVAFLEYAFLKYSQGISGIQFQSQNLCKFITIFVEFFNPTQTLPYNLLNLLIIMTDSHKT